MNRSRIVDLGIAMFFFIILSFAFCLDFDSAGMLEIGDIPLKKVCFFKRLTNLDCPFCGLSRSIVSFAHGDLTSALSYHLLGPCIAVFMSGTIITIIYATQNRLTPVVEGKIFRYLCTLIALLCFVFWGIRKIAI